MHKFQIAPNKYLKVRTQAFHHTDYLGYKQPQNPDYINILKNIPNGEKYLTLKTAVQELEGVLSVDLPQIREELGSNNLTVCVVPRAKVQSWYHDKQLLFTSTVRDVVKKLNGLEDGTDYICRHTDTRTTHLKKPRSDFPNDGPTPYPGITLDTCSISPHVQGKNVLLIDDVYTPGVGIDDDAIQALLCSGATSVAFYAVAKTIKGGR